MNENIEKVTIKYTNGETSEINNSDGRYCITVDIAGKYIGLMEYRKKGQAGQIINRIIMIDNNVRELEIIRT